MKHGVTKGDMCKAVRGNLLSSYISILLCQQKGDITEKQFLTDLAIESSPMYSLAKDIGVDNIIDLFIDCIPRVNFKEGMSLSDKKAIIRKSYIDRTLYRYKDIIVSKIKEYEHKVINISELKSIGDLKLFTLCYDRKNLSNLNHIFDITISNYGMNKAVIAHVIKDALRC